MNGIMDIHHPLLQALGYAMLHAVWQSVLLFCILKLLLAFIPLRLAVWRYRLQYVSLLVLFFLFAGTFYVVYSQSDAIALTGTASAAASVPPGSWALLYGVFDAERYSRFIPWLAIVYTAGLAMLCGPMGWELLRLRQLRRGTGMPEAGLLAHFRQLCQRAGIRRDVLLRLSARVQVPVMLGYLKPVVLLPVSLATRLDMQQMEAILMHELAHIKRNDYFWNILQMVLETLLFFNPVVWWLSAAIREEREHCCDDYVLQHTGQSLPYARALLALEEFRSAGYAPALSALGQKKQPLLNRIKRFTAMNPQKKSGQRTLAIVAVLVLAGVMTCFVTAFGQNKKEKSKEKNTTAKTYSKSYGKSVVTVIDDEGNKKTYTRTTGDTAAFGDAMAAVPEALDAMDMAGDALKDIDWEEMQHTVSQAMNSVDWHEVSASVNNAMVSARKSMKEVDWEEINREVSKAMKEADVHLDDYMKEATEKMEKAMQEARKGMNEETRAEVRRAMEQARADMMAARQEMKRSVNEARRQAMDDARASRRAVLEDARESRKVALEETREDRKARSEEARQGRDAAREDARNAKQSAAAGDRED